MVESLEENSSRVAVDDYNQDFNAKYHLHNCTQVIRTQTVIPTKMRIVEEFYARQLVSIHE